MDVEEAFFLRVEDGKFVDFWALEDGLKRLRQLGLLSSPMKRSEFDRGSHFATMELPDLFIGDVRKFFRELR